MLESLVVSAVLVISSFRFLWFVGFGLTYLLDDDFLDACFSVELVLDGLDFSIDFGLLLLGTFLLIVTYDFFSSLAVFGSLFSY